MRSVTTIIQQFVLYGLVGFAAIGLMSSNYDDSKGENYNFAPDANAKKLVNTSWKIKFVDCPACGERADDIQFLDMGKGLIENKPMRWFFKNDTVHLVTDADACKFEKLFLADENLMYGSYYCKGAPAAKSFTARKKDINGNEIVSTPNTVSAAAITAAAPAKATNGLTFIDKTYMFKRGVEKKYDERRIDAIILHSSYCANSKNDFDVYCVLGEYKRHGVAAHYLIDREGNIHRLAKESDVAFHAGFGKMPDGNNHINTRSIGIEMINSEEEGPNEEQYAALANLVRDIKSRYRIKYIKGHNQICPGRKSDPWRFSWKKFYNLVDFE